MKIKHIISLLLALVLVFSLLTGCGGASKAAYDMAAAEIAEAPAAMAEEYGNGAALTGASQEGSSALPESRKWIITMHIDAETEDLDAMTEALDEKIAAMDGYVEDQNIHNGSAYSTRRYRRASLTIRIPAGDVDTFTEEVSGIANVVSCEKNLEDITLNYVATENRVQALETEQTRLLELLAQAENMSDLLEIESRLTEVRYELENYASRLRLYDNQIDYATIHLSIEEVQEYTPVEEPTVWERITGGFSDSLKALGESLVDLLVWVIVSSPFLLVYGGLAFIAIKLGRKLNAVRKARKLTKQQKKEQDP